MSPLVRMAAYARLARWDKPAGFLLLLWPTLWAVWLAADGQPGWQDWGLFVAGVFLTRSFGCCVNDIADRKLDAQVARTRDRPLAAASISVTEAVVVAGSFLLPCFFLWLQLATPARLWALAALAIAVTYPLAKRVLVVPQLHLGLAFGMGIPVAHAHLDGAVPDTAWLLLAANLCWVFAYDTIYAMVDRQDDLAAGNQSAAIWLGERDLQGVGLAYFFMLMLMLSHAVAHGAGLGFYLACGLGWGMALRFCRMIRSRAPADCLRAFHQNHWLGALLWLGLVADTAAR